MKGFSPSDRNALIKPQEGSSGLRDPEKGLWGGRTGNIKMNEKRPGAASSLGRSHAARSRSVLAESQRPGCGLPWQHAMSGPC